MRGYHGLDMTSGDWLTSHFLAKAPDRQRQVSTLDISRGARVLDLCCGPGFFIPFLLNMVGPLGHVTGVDQDAILLDSAHGRLSSLPAQNWDLQLATIDEYKPHFADFDLILLFNSIGYFPDPIELVRAIISGMKLGSTLIVKDFDSELLFFHPRRTDYWSALLVAAQEQNIRQNPLPFDNFLGRHVHMFGERAGLASSRSWTWTQMMRQPFDHHQREYIWRSVECLINQAGKLCPDDIRDYFVAGFYPPDAGFFAMPESMFLETEMLTALTK